MMFYLIIIIFGCICAKTMKNKVILWIFVEVGILFYLSDASRMIGSGHIIPLLVSYILSYYFADKYLTEQNKKNINNNNYYKWKYLNHCWNCKEPINSEIDKKCPRCNKYYICSKCNKCKCDSPYYNE